MDNPESCLTPTYGWKLATTLPQSARWHKMPNAKVQLSRNTKNTSSECIMNTKANSQTCSKVFNLDSSSSKSDINNSLTVSGIAKNEQTHTIKLHIIFENSVGNKI